MAFKMSALILLAALLAAKSASYSIHEYSCVSSREPCTLQNVVLESESDLDRVSFPAIANSLTIESGKIPNFTRKLSAKLTGLVDLTINRIEVETIYVKPEMTLLQATHNRIQTLLLDNDQSKVYEMISLDLTANNISSVAILSRFSKLRQLILDENNLEKLSMDVFGAMPELRKLSVANNHLFSVDTDNALQLLKLRSLSLAGNGLIELNIEKWEMDSLVELDISRNQLYLLEGSLEQFGSLTDVKIAENHWKCDFLIEINRLKRLKFDRDQNVRCKKMEMAEVKEVCCIRDAFTVLGNTTGLFEDKWEELRQLNASLQQFKNSTEIKLEKIGDLEQETNEKTLIERIKQLEAGQENIWTKLNNDNHAALVMEETNELKSAISDHKSTIENLESKQGDLASELEGFVERLNSLREGMEEKFDAVGEVKERVEQLEEKTKGNAVELVEKKIAELRDAFKQLEGQQLKYHLLSVDLKSQIGVERSKITKVQEQYTNLLRNTDELRKQMSSAQEDIYRITDTLYEINTDD